ncbi:MAG: hypothetical protein IT174_08910 [Acidobacteria bacterium]|nr:hypothetical protein [Acidobacteriota bacterium]
MASRNSVRRGNLVFERTDDHNMQTTTYDTAGRRVVFRDRWRMSASASEETETQFVFDGDGRPVVERHGSRTISTPTPPPMVVATTGYQVWSSVLGSSLTSVNTSGEKVETKVFAGGTHIATQYEMNPATTSDDSLTFITADPVTGSVARYSGSGASADIDETEPLGQTVETFDPGSGYPTSYEEVRGIARDPEWQCMLPKEFTGVFNEMPVHCKKAQLNGRDFNLPLALAESDPKRVVKPSPSLTDDRPPKFEIPGDDKSPSNLALAFAAKATDKSSTKEDEGGCDWDKDGKDDCALTVGDPGPDPLDALASADASLSGQIEPGPYDLKDLIKATQGVIENAKGRCAELLGKGALAEFNRLAKNIVYDPEAFANSGAGHSARTTGEIIRLNPNSYTFNPSIRPLDFTPPGKKLKADLDKLFKKSKASSWYEYAVAAVIHEFLHAIGEFDDDTTVTAFGTDSSESIKNQNEVIKKCFREQDKK